MPNTPIFNGRTDKPSIVLAAIRMLVLRLQNVLLSHHEDKIARRAFLNTFHLDDRMLDDIGVTREEVEWAANLPIRVNASQALHARSSARRGSELS
jgi:uncharacterized protein YjiS (DUF1127 family)